MPDLSDISLTLSIVLFVAAVAIGLIGTRLIGVTDTLADRTGLVEALVGAGFRESKLSEGG